MPTDDTGSTTPIDTAARPFHPDRMRTADVAAYMGVSYETVRRLRDLGRLPSQKVSDKIYFYRQADVDAYLKAHRTGGESA